MNRIIGIDQGIEVIGIIRVPAGADQKITGVEMSYGVTPDGNTTIQELGFDDIVVPKHERITTKDIARGVWCNGRQGVESIGAGKIGGNDVLRFGKMPVGGDKGFLHPTGLKLMCDIKVGKEMKADKKKQDGQKSPKCHGKPVSMLNSLHNTLI